MPSSVQRGSGFPWAWNRGMFGPAPLIPLVFQRLLCLFRIRVVKVGRQCVTSFLGGGGIASAERFLFIFKMFHLFIYSFLYLLGFTRFELRPEGSFSCSVYNLVS